MHYRLVSAAPMANTPEDPWRGSRVLVTGASGFVGKWLVHALSARGAEVTACVGGSSARLFETIIRQWPSIKTATGRMEDYRFLERTLADDGIESVFHLAAANTNLRLGKSPLPLFEANVRGVYNLLEASRVCGSVRRIVVASSAEARHDLRVSELPKNNRARRYSYQASKLAAEVIAQSFYDSFGVPVAIARCHNIYGGGDTNWTRLIPATIRSVLTGRAPIIRTDGMLKRDYIHIDDIVEAYLLLMNKMGEAGFSGEIFNFGTGARFATLEIVREITRLAGRPDILPVVLNESTDEVMGDDCSFQREFDQLGWRSKVGIERGLASTIDWYSSHRAELMIG